MQFHPAANPDLVERDVLRREVRRRRHRDAVAQAVGVAQRPAERLHAAAPRVVLDRRRDPSLEDLDCSRRVFWHLHHALGNRRRSPGGLGLAAPGGLASQSELFENGGDG